MKFHQFLLILLSSGAWAAPLSDVLAAHRYLQRFGYTQETTGTFSQSSASESHFSHEELQAPLKEFQEHFGIDVTGKLDSATLELMSKRRCGVKDVDIKISARLSAPLARFEIHESKWSSSNLTYYIENFSGDLPSQTARSEINRAFNDWAAVSNLKFHSVDQQPADIVVLFGTRFHGDPYPFDGAGGVLAHAYYPRFGGDIHFDDDEFWTSQSYEGVNLYQVALHEIGHSLGLRHSSVRGAIMYPAYLGYRPDAGLHQDDIDGIRAHYGQPSTTPSTTTPTSITTSSTSQSTKSTNSSTTSTSSSISSTPTTRFSPSSSSTATSTSSVSTSTVRPVIRNACEISQWDAVLTTRDKSTYFFSGEYFYKQGVIEPKPISGTWQGIHGSVDAALTMKSGLSLIIQGEYFSVFSGATRYDFTTRKIGNYFGKLARTVDAAWTWSKDRTFYLVKGDQVWRNNNDYRLDETYPRRLRDEFPGLPSHIDAATTDKQGLTHFFLGEHFYTLDNNQARVTQPPRRTSSYWFPC